MAFLIGLAAFLLTLVFILLTQVILRVIKVRLVYDEFKKSTGLPMLPKPWSPAGHDHVFGFNRYVWMQMEPLHRRYGRSFGWMGGTCPCVATIDLDLIKKVVLDEPNLHIDRPDLNLPYSEMSSNNIAFSRAEQWYRMRRAMTPALTLHKIKSEISGEIESIIVVLIDSIEVRMGSNDDIGEGIELDFSDLMLHFTTEVVYSCFYGQKGRINFVGKRNHHIVDSEIGLQGLSSNLITVSRFFPQLNPIIGHIGRKFHPSGKVTNTLFDFIQQQTKLNFEARQKRSSGDKLNYKRSIIDAFIDSFHEGKLTYDEYMNSSFFFYFAASKTTADGIALTAFYLARHQDVQDKLRQSIIKDGIESEYLGWCINESMRLQPPSLAGSARCLSKNIEYKNLVIPKGTLVMGPSYTIHRLREYWGPDANEFKPERFRHAKDFHPAQYMPFGVGKRSCPGKDFALHEMKLTLVALLSRYKFEMCDRTVDTILFTAPFNIMTIYENPIYLRLRRLKTDTHMLLK